MFCRTFVFVDEYLRLCFYINISLVVYKVAFAAKRWLKYKK